MVPCACGSHGEARACFRRATFATHPAERSNGSRTERSKRNKLPASSRRERGGNVWSTHWTTAIGLLTSHPAAFLIVILYGLLWYVFEPASFDWHAIATLIVWTMTLFI
jgi:hypothetical protein